MQKSNVLEQWTVKEEQALLESLFTHLSNKSRNAVKGILNRGQVLVNQKKVTQFDRVLRIGDTVTVLGRVASDDVKLIGVTILFEDDDLLVIDKSAGLLSVGTVKERDKTAYKQCTQYVKSIHPRNRIFVVHRLDRETSGVMVFAKNEATKQRLMDEWQERVKTRQYVAVVEGSVKKGGTIKSWLKENKAYIVFSSKFPGDGQLALTHYQPLKTSRKYSLVEVQLETGRKNQIRVHMQDIQHPVVGDKKYGSTTNPLKRLGLHAHKLAFIHPTTEKLVTFQAKIPKIFHSLFPSK